ncbi:unnamed protein product, partial [Brenthis ino]
MYAEMFTPSSSAGVKGEKCIRGVHCAGRVAPERGVRRIATARAVQRPGSGAGEGGRGLPSGRRSGTAVRVELRRYFVPIEKYNQKFPYIKKSGRRAHSDRLEPVERDGRVRRLE